VLAQTPFNIRKVTLHYLPCFIANCNNVEEPVCAVSEWYNCQLLQSVHEYVDPSQLSNQVMWTTDCSQFLSLLPVFIKSAATLSITYRRSVSPSNCTLYSPAQTLSLSAFCGPF